MNISYFTVIAGWLLIMFVTHEIYEGYLKRKYDYTIPQKGYFGRVDRKLLKRDILDEKDSQKAKALRNLIYLEKITFWVAWLLALFIILRG